LGKCSHVTIEAYLDVQAVTPESSNIIKNKYIRRKKSMNKSNIGYLPDERPPFGKLLLYAIQQVIVMFPATIAVALITGFQVSTTIFASGLATICFALITGKKLPLYYGSSFAYLSRSEGICNIKRYSSD
jgi:hypothetical protein